jgi:hypothetical protein
MSWRVNSRFRNELSSFSDETKSRFNQLLTWTDRAAAIFSTTDRIQDVRQCVSAFSASGIAKRGARPEWFVHSAACMIAARMQTDPAMSDRLPVFAPAYRSGRTYRRDFPPY